MTARTAGPARPPVDPPASRPGLHNMIGPLALLGVFAIALGAVFWGAFGADNGIRVFRYDAGPVTDFAVGEVVPLADLDVYVVGLEDGQLRAVDGRVESTGCAVRFLPDDTRALDRNPAGQPGVFVDPCGPGVWSSDGDALGDTAPLRTFVLSAPEREDGEVRRVIVEVVGRDRPDDGRVVE